jgi:Transglycosylase SLT domain/SPOR domain
MKLLIGFSQTRASKRPIRIRSLDGCVLAFLLGFAVAAHAQPASTLDRQATFGESTVLTSQGPNTKLVQAAPTETDTRGGPSNAAVHPSMDAICDAIASAAVHNDLPLAFFTRLIWQESHFDPLLVSSKGARGIAQFMPATASWRGLKNPFDPIEAIAKAGRLLNELRGEFGNIGLAAAAYNAGSQRVRQWLARRQGLPRETQQYVRVITGQRAEEWTVSATATAPLHTSPDIPCRPNEGRLAKAPPSAAQASSRLGTPPNSQRSDEDELATAPPPTAGAVPAPPFAWVVQLIGKPSRALATLAWSQLKQKHAVILADREPLLVETKLSGGMSWYRVRIGTDGLETARALCAQLENAGANCLVQRN